MSPEAEQLEKYRTFFQELGDLSFNLDGMEHFNYTGPDLELYTRAAKRAHADKEQKEMEFTSLLSKLRKEKPEVIKEWVDFHLDYIHKRQKSWQEEKERGRDVGFELYVAEETIEEWNKVLRGEKNWVVYNPYVFPLVFNSYLES